jgi:hypothetical protein
VRSFALARSVALREYTLKSEAAAEGGRASRVVGALALLRADAFSRASGSSKPKAATRLE